MADIATLTIAVQSDGVTKANKRLDDLDKQSSKAERATNSVGAASRSTSTSMLKMAASIGAATLAYKGFKAVVSTAAEFEKLNAMLKTVTGSTEAAAEAMELIRKTAASTPFSVQEMTNSFIKLKSLGLDPSEDALTSYANTAAAMGKSLNQVIEAVADASTMEFERLKEFGIKSRQAADTVTFTFNKVATTVKKDAASIEGYLRSIGDVQFAGAAVDQMDTINGALSNMGDAFDQLLLQVGDQGFSGEVKESLQKLVDFLSDSKTVDAATKLGTGILKVFDFVSKAVANAVLEFTDFGDLLGSYAAIVAKVFELDFKGISAIIDAREVERAAVEKSIDLLWEKKRATDALNDSESKTGGGGKTKKSGGGVKEVVKQEKEAYDALFDLYEKEERYNEDLQAQREAGYSVRVNRLQEFTELYRSAQETEMALHQERLDAIREGRESDFEHATEWNEIEFEEEARHARALQALDEDTANKRQQLTDRQRQIAMTGLRNTASIFSSLATIVGGSSKKAFEAQKMLQRASIIASTAAGVMRSYSDLGPIGGAIAKGAVLLEGAAALATVNRTQYGGGGGAISMGGGSGASPNVAPPVRPDQGLMLGGSQGNGRNGNMNVNVTVNGSVLGADLDTIVTGAVKRATDKDSMHIIVNGQRAEVQTTNG